MPLSKRVEVWLALASHYNKAGEPRKALEYVGKVLAADTPQEFACLAHAVSSNCYRNLGMWEESIREAKICLTLPCRHTTVRQNMCLDMAYCYEQLGKASEAHEALQRAVSMDPKSDAGKLAATILANGWPKNSQSGQVSGREE